MRRLAKSRPTSILRLGPLALSIGVFIAGLLQSSPARSDHIGVIVDTSGSMVNNDPDQVALLASLMLADLLDYATDDLFVLPFDPAQRSVEHEAAASLHRRRDHPPDQSGTDAYVAELLAGIVYDDDFTYFAPAIAQGLAEFDAATRTHEHKLLILLTDGNSNDPDGEISILNTRLAKSVRDARASVWMIGLGSGPGATPEVSRYFASRRLGGYVEAANPGELLGAFATVLSSAVQRDLETHRVSAGGTLNLQLGSSLVRSDLVLSSLGSGPTSSTSIQIDDATGASWTAGSPQLDVSGEVTAVHPNGVRGRTRSYRRIRLEAPTPGVWSVTPSAPVDLLVLQRHAFDARLGLRVATGLSPSGTRARVPVGETICMDLQVVSRSSARSPSGPVTDPRKLVDLEAYLEVVDRNTVAASASAPRRLDDDGSSPHDAVAMDGSFGKCWTPTQADMGGLFDLTARLHDRTVGVERAVSRGLSIDVIPAMHLDPTPTPVVFQGGAAMQTGETDCQLFTLSRRSSYYQQDGSSQRWLPKAQMLVEVGHLDSGSWIGGLPAGEPVENVSLTLDGIERSLVPTAGGAKTVGWAPMWQMNSPSHEVCITLGARTTGGRSTKPMALKMTPRDPTYATYGIQALAPLDVDTVEPEFWEVYGSLVLTAGAILAGIIAWLLSLRPLPLPPGLSIQVGETETEPGAREELSGRACTVERAGIHVRSTRLGPEFEVGLATTIEVRGAPRGDWAPAPLTRPERLSGSGKSPPLLRRVRKALSPSPERRCWRPQAGVLYRVRAPDGRTDPLYILLRVDEAR